MKQLVFYLDGKEWASATILPSQKERLETVLDYLCCGDLQHDIRYLIRDEKPVEFLDSDTRTYVSGKFDKFVVVYNGLAYWFKMKGQYLFRVSTEEDFQSENDNIKIEKLRYTPIPGSIISLNVLFYKRKFFAEHPVDKEGKPRKGVELLIEYQIRGRERDEREE